MYINDLGIGRNHSVQSHVTKTNRTAYRKKTDDYATVMKEAVENQKYTVNPFGSSAEDVILKEAFEKMKTDPEWEETVMNKVKEYYTTDRTAGSAQTDALSWTRQNSLQNYLLQNLVGGSSLGCGFMGYSPYSMSSLAAAAYGNVMNGAAGSSLFGNYYL